MYRTQSGRRLRILKHQGWLSIDAKYSADPWKVAGQAPLLRLSKGKICKPLADNEYEYYEELIQGEKSLYAEFHPIYYGPIYIYPEEEKPQVRYYPVAMFVFVMLWLIS